ncbi:hypothetical protein MRX96_030272 [Rhipicephalus microplus]
MQWRLCQDVCIATSLLLQEEDIKELIRSILDGADLEEITMKKVIHEVFDKYPNHDLSGKKEYIKSTVRSLIS